MTRCATCGSYAINHHAHGRDGSDGDLCDVCYWRIRALDMALTLCAVHSAVGRAETGFATSSSAEEFLRRKHAARSEV